MDDRPRATLRPLDAAAITVGIVLGAGVFKTPSLVAAGVGSPAELIGVWVAGGIVALVGALCYAELAAAHPHAGGDYHFIRLAFGRRIAFLYAWSRLAVIQTGSIAVLAFVAGDYLTAVAPLGPASPAIYAALAVAGVTAVNWLGVRHGARAQNWLTLVEVSGLLLVIAAGLFFAPAATAVTPPTAGGSAGDLGLVMVFVLLTYGGWNEAAYVSAELEGGGRRIGRVLLVSIAVIALLYVLANLAYLRALSLGGMASSDAVAVDVMRRAFGPVGAGAVALAVAVASLTSANATAITGARSAWALGRDAPPLRWLGHWDGASDSPRHALLTQGATALLLVVAGAFARGGFQLAVEYTAPVFWFFFLLAGLSLFVLRRKEPGRHRPFRVPGYPVTPALFCLANAYLLWSSLAYTGWGALVGVAVLVLGVLFLPFLRERTA